MQSGSCLRAGDTGSGYKMAGQTSSPLRLSEKSKPLLSYSGIFHFWVMPDEILIYEFLDHRARKRNVTNGAVCCPQVLKKQLRSNSLKNK